MQNLDLENLSELISHKLGRDIRFIKCEPLSSGYHSNGYCLYTINGEKFFIKKIKSDDLGFELPERKINSLLISNQMSQHFPPHPKGIGVLIKNQDIKYLLPEVDDQTEIYHIQEIIPQFDKTIKNYWQVLNERKDKNDIDDTDVQEINIIINVISEIHCQRHSNQDVASLKKIYNDGFRSLITHPELTIMLLQKYPADSKILPRDQHEKYLGLILNNIYKWEDRYDRLRPLHGDFWGTNLYFINDQAYLVDFSRIPWGDAGTDVGWWVAQYLWLWYETKNKYYKNLFDLFIKSYSKKTGDNEISETISPVLGVMGIIYTNPAFYPNLDLNIANSFMENIWHSLKRQRFVW